MVGFAKINVDGGISCAADRGAASAICKDADKNSLGASTVVIESLTDPAIPKAIVCSEGLSLALDLNLSHVQVATDCMVGDAKHKKSKS